MKILDTSIIIGILILVITIFWLSHKEMRKSIERMKKSEKVFENEKKSLNIRIEEQNTELKRERVERMNDLAKVAEFGRLSQGLFHDLMTPLTSVILNTEKLRDAHGEEIKQTRENIERAIDASRRMANYIQNIRSNMQGKHSESQCNLHEELKSTLELFSFRLKKENVTVILTDSVDIVWHGDIIKMRQIFSNLISNALDSFEEDKENKEIQLSIEKTHELIKILVRDNGIGMSETLIQKIFEPFFSTKSRDKGTGIGLSTVRSIVENDFKGKIVVKSEIRKGSAFSIEIPVKK